MKKFIFIFLFLQNFFLFGQNLASIHSAFEETNPVLSVEGDELYFSRRGDPRNVGLEDLSDIWMSIKQSDGDWLAPINLGLPVNGNGTENVLALSMDKKKLFFQNAQNELFFSVRNGRTWQTPQAFKIEGIEKMNPQQYWISKDLKTILICGKGEEKSNQQLFISTLSEDEKSWMALKTLSLGNFSQQKDIHFAQMSQDKKRLYWIATKAKSTQNPVLYVSKRLNDALDIWSNPEELLNIKLDEQPSHWNFTLESNGKNMLIVKEGNIERIELESEAQATAIRSYNLSLETQNANESPVFASIISLNNNIKADSILLRPNIVSKMLLPQEGIYGISIQKNAYFSACQPVLTEELSNYLLDSSPDNNKVYGADNSDYLLETAQLKLNEIVPKIESFKVVRYSQINWNEWRTKLLNQDTLIKEIEKQQIIASKSKKVAEKSNKQGISGNVKEDVSLAIEKNKEEFDRFISFENATVESTLTPKAPIKESNEKTIKKEKEELSNEELGAIAAIQESVEQNRPLSFDDLKQNVEQQIIEEHWLLELGNIENKAMRVAEEKVAVKFNNAESRSLRLNITDISEGMKDELLNLQRQRKANLSSNFTQKINFKDANINKIRQNLLKILENDVSGMIRSKLEDTIQMLVQKELEFRANQKLAFQLERLIENLMDKKDKNKNKATIEFENLIKDTLITTTQKAFFASKDKFIRLYPLLAGQNIPLYNIFFEPNSAILLPYSYMELRKIEDLLKKNQNIGIEIKVHTNGAYNTEVAKNLTDKRAKTLMDYLLDKGVDVKQFTISSFGRLKPIESNLTQEGRQKNQRIEMLIVRN